MVEVIVLLRMLNLLVQPWLLKDGWMDGWVDGWMDGWVNGWMGGWMDGWVGCDFLIPSIFFIFKYDNKQDVLISNIWSKSIKGFYIKIYEHFKIQNSEI